MKMLIVVSIKFEIVVPKIYNITRLLFDIQLLQDYFSLPLTNHILFILPI